MVPHSLSHTLGHSLLAVIGFLLSPLSWWNDLLVNIPIAYLLALPFRWLHPSLYLPAFVLSYWFTNWLGFVLMQKGLRGLANPTHPAGLRRRDLLISLAYTALIILMVLLNWLPVPA